MDPVPLMLMTGFGYDPGPFDRQRPQGRPARLRRPLQALPAGSTAQRRRAHHRGSRPGAAGIRELRTAVRLMDAALLLLALLGHAALWVRPGQPPPRPRPAALDHPLGARPPASSCCRWSRRRSPGGAWRPIRRSLDRLRAGEFLRSAPVGVLAYLCVCCGGRARSSWSRWLRRHVLHRPPDVLRSHGVRSLLHRDAPPPETAEHPHHFLVRLPGNQSLHLDLTERAIEVPRLPPAWDGLSLVHLSDLHFTGRVGKPYFQEIVRLSNELQPDLVVLTGDLVDRPRCIDWIPDTLSRLDRPLRRLLRAGKSRHPRRRGAAGPGAGRVRAVLLGRAPRADRDPRPAGDPGGQRACLGCPAADLEHCPPPRQGGPFRIALAHSPDQLDWARAHDVDLLLAGHTHGGQIRLPLVGPIFTPSRRGLRYAAGVFHAPPTIMHVTRGVSGSFPLRWNCARKWPGWCFRRKGQTKGIRDWD